ncbi:MAG: hypothetical protein Q8J65_08705 [Nitrosomonadales bacterium]|nr:hypothetical protein [Nitrosomonadales bacterium]
MRKITQLLLIMMTSSLPAMTYAASCDNLREDIKTASDYLNSSQQAKSLDDAKRMMNKAKYAINEIANDARECPCLDAANLFDDAATKIRRASDADVAGRFNDFVKQGVELYGAGIDALNSCPESQQNPVE